MHTQLQDAGVKWRTAEGFYKAVDSLDAGPHWKCKLLPVKGDLDSAGAVQVETVEFLYKDLLEIVKSLLEDPDLADDSIYCPTREYTDNSKKNRIYSEAMTGDWAWELQVSYKFNFYHTERVTNT